ncbi:MAG: hypothetical protein KatS3mg030_620 [Saprospiraceae bacterium]|nr:MAG: hypothetical protein KatS3mg030_620 [Saprospiraceae bacterium]
MDKLNASGVARKILFTIQPKNDALAGASFLGIMEDYWDYGGLWVMGIMGPAFG